MKSLIFRYVMEIVSILGCCKSRIKHNKVYVSEDVRRLGVVCLPLFEIVGEVMIHSHWCAGSLNN